MAKIFTLNREGNQKSHEDYNICNVHVVSYFGFNCYDLLKMNSWMLSYLQGIIKVIALADHQEPFFC